MGNGGNDARARYLIEQLHQVNYDYELELKKMIEDEAEKFEWSYIDN